MQERTGTECSGKGRQFAGLVHGRRRNSKVSVIEHDSVTYVDFEAGEYPDIELISDLRSQHQT